MYTTVEEVMRTSELVGEENITTPDMNDVIKNATSRIHSRLGKRYKTPFTDPVPEAITTIASWLAGGYLLERYYGDRRHEQEKEGLASVLIRRAEDWLDEIMEDQLLDSQPGIEIILKPNPTGSKAVIASTKPRENPEMEKILGMW